MNNLQNIKTPPRRSGEKFDSTSIAKPLLIWPYAAKFKKYE